MSDHLDSRTSEPPNGRRSTRRAPSYASLPPAKNRRTRGGPELCTISVRLEIVTPILGGGVRTRELDEVEIVRVPTIRGHLRSSWRALNAHRFETPQDLYTEESGLWGRAANDMGGRSAVDLEVDVEHAGTIDGSDIKAYGSGATEGAYALWPARKEKTTRTPQAPRRRPGTQFRLRIAAPKDREREIHNAIRAWILFGGYGGRTRRGLGSLRVLEDASTWLPSAPTRAAITTLFDQEDIFASTDQPALDVARLRGGSLHVGGAMRDATRAWTTALDWLQTFRQGTAGSPGTGARESSAGKPQPQRPSISNWPEADKVRHLTPAGRLPWAHPPRHNSEPAWPRAGFGLPIIGQFQQKDRTGTRYNRLDPPTTEPKGFELHWHSEEEEHDRLASPLIVKAMALANGTFVPCALWLDRAFPDGEVVLRDVSRSGAPFGTLVAAGDTPQFAALQGKRSLRDAFLDWLQIQFRTTEVAP